MRGHSNVQGNRTCGINHRPAGPFLDRLAEACHIDPPREHGLNVVQTLQAMHAGSVKVLVSLGGNLAGIPTLAALECGNFGGFLALFKSATYHGVAALGRDRCGENLNPGRRGQSY